MSPLSPVTNLGDGSRDVRDITPNGVSVQAPRPPRQRRAALSSNPGREATRGTIIRKKTIVASSGRRGGPTPVINPPRPTPDPIPPKILSTPPPPPPQHPPPA